MAYRFLTILFPIVCVPVWSQNILTGENNLPRDSDDVFMESVPFCWEGESGDGVTWDFSQNDNNGDCQTFYFRKGPSGKLYQIADNDVESYSCTSGCLRLCSSENRFFRMSYYKPKLAMKFPFQYGDSLSAPFMGYGNYCGDHSISVCGQVILQADGVGKLILSGNDTLNNVLRVYSLTTTSLNMETIVASIDSSMSRQEIEEKYEWYAKGYRYPVFKTVQRTSFKNDVLVGTTRYALRFLPESYLLSGDYVNDSIRHADSIAVSRGGMQAHEATHYSVHVEGSQVVIDYESEGNTSLSIVLSDSMGVIYKQQRIHAMAGGHETITFNCSDLHRGQYILYFNENGHVTSKTIAI